MKLAIRRPGMKLALPLASLCYALSIATVMAQGCLTDGEIEAAVGDQVRSGAPLVDTSVLPNRPLCSGLTIAQAIQRIREEAFPEEVAEDEAIRQGLIARERGPRRAVRRPVRRAPVARRARATASPAPAATPAPSRKVQSKTGPSTTH
jgi:hypothetical protein